MLLRDSDNLWIKLRVSISRPPASTFVHSGPLPLAELGVRLAWSLRGYFATFFDLFISAAVHNLAFFSLLVEASFFVGCLADFRVFSRTKLRGLGVAHLSNLSLVKLEKGVESSLFITEKVREKLLGVGTYYFRARRYTWSCLHVLPHTDSSKRKVEEMCGKLYRVKKVKT